MPLPQGTRPIRRSTVRQIVYHKIRDWIADGTLAPGETIKDTDIAAAIGVSRTPVREALQMLEQAEVIETVAGRHTRVSQARASDIGLVLEPLATLHGLAAETATPFITLADLRAMTAANRDLEAALGRGDHIAARSADERFHDVLMDRAGNRYLAMAVGGLLFHARRLETLCFGHLGTSEESVREHELIIEAIRARDAQRAGRLNRSNWLSSFHRAFGDEVPLADREEQGPDRASVGHSD